MKTEVKMKMIQERIKKIESIDLYVIGLKEDLKTTPLKHASHPGTYKEFLTLEIKRAGKVKKKVQSKLDWLQLQ